MSLLEEWATAMRASNLAPTTISLRLRVLRAFVRHANVDDPLLLTRRHVAAYLGRDLKPWSKITYWRVVDAWRRWLADYEIADVDILKATTIARRPDPVPRPISDATVERLLAADLSPRIRAYVTLALFQALRVHESAKLRGTDFDLRSGYLLVDGKGGSTVQVPLHPEVAALAESMPRIGWWFPSPVDPSRPVRPATVSCGIGRALRSVGSSATAHQLRDTSATMMQRQRHDLRFTQKYLRHRNVADTEKYVAVDDEALREAIASIRWGVAA